MPATQADLVVMSSSTVVALLLSAYVATIGAPVVMPPSLSALVILPSAVLAAMEFPSLSSCPCVSLDHLYTSSDVDSLWGATYKPGQKTSTSFVSTFEKNLIRPDGVQNATDSTKAFLQRSLAIVEENKLWNQEVVQKVVSLEVEVAK